MKFEIRARGLEMTAELRAHAEKRLRFALDRAASDIGRVVVWLRDINGPRGGTDKRCEVRIPLQGAPDVLIADTAGDLLVAIDRAAERARQTLARRRTRRREFAHHAGRLLAPAL